LKYRVCVCLSPFPCPGGPKSHRTDVKPISKSCLLNQCKLLLDLKCCAALSECTHSTVILFRANTPLSRSALTILATKKRME